MIANCNEYGQERDQTLADSGVVYKQKEQQ
jgi:hypothetical protein